MATDKYTTVINVQSTLKDGGNWLLRSDNLPGLLLCGKDIKKLHADVPNVIKSLYRLNYGMKVTVVMGREPCDVKTQRKTHDIKPTGNWVAIPAA